mgnify:CR=1 FL=1
MKTCNCETVNSYKTKYTGGNDIMKTIETKNAPAAIGPYSQAKVANGFVYASGQVPLDPATGEVVGTTIEEQTEQIMKNIGAILEVAGVTYENVIKTTCFLAEMADFGAFNAVYDKYFTGKHGNSPSDRRRTEKIACIAFMVCR